MLARARIGANVSQVTTPDTGLDQDSGPATDHAERPRTRRRWLTPPLGVAAGFAGIIAVGTGALLLPAAAAPGVTVEFGDALFTATSATCLTGLITVDTATHWSVTGQIIIMALIQAGGLGFMTMASLLMLLMAGRLGVRATADASAEGRGIDRGEVKWVVRATLIFTVVIEAIVAIVLGCRFHFGYGYGLGRSVWEGVFHAISAFNNAGFALYTNNVMDFNSDAWVLLPLAFALMIGGLGFPVLLEAARRFLPGRRHRRWSITARFTFWGTVILVIAGCLMVGLAEWNGAMKALSVPVKLLNTFFASVSPRTAGFNALDYAEFHRSTLLGTDILMVIGAGSGGTAGGVKVTTAAVLVAAILAEIRGRETVSIFRRRIPPASIRQALAVLSFAVILVVGAVTALLFLAPGFTTDQIAFEVSSAFATVGLSTGITGDLPRTAQLVLIVLMYAGRIGPVVLATALAANTRPRRYEFPEERPSIG